MAFREAGITHPRRRTKGVGSCEALLPTGRVVALELWDWTNTLWYFSLEYLQDVATLYIRNPSTQPKP